MENEYIFLTSCYNWLYIGSLFRCCDKCFGFGCCCSRRQILLVDWSSWGYCTCNLHNYKLVWNCLGKCRFCLRYLTLFWLKPHFFCSVHISQYDTSCKVGYDMIGIWRYPTCIYSFSDRRVAVNNEHSGENDHRTS